VNAVVLQEQGIPLLLLSDDSLDFYKELSDPRWNKVSLLRRVAELSRVLKNRRYNLWLLWMDADLVILNSTVIRFLRGEIKYANDNGVHFIAASDSRPESGVLNTGRSINT